MNSLVAGSDLEEAENGVADGDGKVEVGGFHEQTLLHATHDHHP